MNSEQTYDTDGRQVVFDMCCDRLAAGGYTDQEAMLADYARQLRLLGGGALMQTQPSNVHLVIAEQAGYTTHHAAKTIVQVADR